MVEKKQKVPAAPKPQWPTDLTHPVNGRRYPEPDLALSLYEVVVTENFKSRAMFVFQGDKLVLDHTSLKQAQAEVQEGTVFTWRAMGSTGPYMNHRL